MTIHAFDFDGTLTRRDTLIEFIRYVKGNKEFLIGFLPHRVPEASSSADFDEDWHHAQLEDQAHHFPVFLRGNDLGEIQ